MKPLFLLFAYKHFSNALVSKFLGTGIALLYGRGLKEGRAMFGNLIINLLGA